MNKQKISDYIVQIVGILAALLSRKIYDKYFNFHLFVDIFLAILSGVTVYLVLVFLIAFTKSLLGKEENSSMDTEGN